MGEGVDMSSGNTDKQADATTADAACKRFRTEMTDIYDDIPRSDSDTRGMVYSGFLYNLADFNHTGKLTKEQIQADKSDPCFNEKEREMLDFTETHFKQLTKMRPEGDAGKEISNGDITVLRNYPEAKLTDPNFRHNLQEKFGWIGAGVGTGVEVGAYVFATPVALGISTYGSATVGAAVTIGRGGDVVSGAAAAAAFSVAWGPLTGGIAGAALAHQVAEPYWNMTQGRRINKLYNQMTNDIPTFNEYKADLLPEN